MKTCNIKRSDRIKFRSVNGDANLIARFRRTRKGQRLKMDGREWGVKGRDGSDYYSLRIGGDGIFYCSCVDYKIRGHKSNKDNKGSNYMCKHVRAYLSMAAKMIDDGVAMNSEAIIYNEAVTVSAIERLGGYALQGQKVAFAKAV